MASDVLELYSDGSNLEDQDVRVRDPEVESTEREEITDDELDLVEQRMMIRVRRCFFSLKHMNYHLNLSVIM